MTFKAPNSMVIPLTWETVASSDDLDWCFADNSKISRDFKGKIQGPQIYRFCFHPPDTNLNEITGFVRIYVGESQHFEKRCARYVRALAKMRMSTSPVVNMNVQDLDAAWKNMQRDPCVRIAAALQNASIDKGKVKLQLLKFEESWINGVEVSPEKIGNPFVRRLLENLAILSSDGIGIHLMNQGRSVEAKSFQRLLGSIAKRSTTQQYEKA